MEIEISAKIVIVGSASSVTFNPDFHFPLGTGGGGEPRGSPASKE
ncbi:hypothetical protein GCM10020370_09360 [Paenibacillus hodogayensis]